MSGGENGKWYMECSNGESIAMEEVDYLLRADDSDVFSVILKNSNMVNDVTSVSFVKKDVSGIETVTEVKNEPACFPNPVSHTLYISGLKDGESGLVVSMDGRTVKEFEAGSTEVSLPVSDLPDGVYFVKTKNSVLRFLKKQ